MIGTMKIEVLEDWNPWWNNIEPYVPPKLHGVIREQLANIIPFLASEQIKVLVGVRRSGKSTLLRQIIAYLLKNKIVTPNDVL